MGGMGGHGYGALQVTRRRPTGGRWWMDEKRRDTRIQIKVGRTCIFDRVAAGVLFDVGLMVAPEISRSRLILVRESPELFTCYPVFVSYLDSLQLLRLDELPHSLDMHMQDLGHLVGRIKNGGGRDIIRFSLIHVIFHC